MTLRKSAPRPTKPSPGAAKPPKPMYTIIATEDIAAWPARDADSVEMSGNFVMKTGCKMAQFYGTASKHDGAWETDGEEDALSVTHRVIPDHPGDAVDSENFMQSWLGVPAAVIVDFCDGSPKKVYGTACAPVQLRPGFRQNSEGTGYTMTFEAYAPTNLLPGRYSGEIVLNAPFDVADAEAMALTKENGTQYKLPVDVAGKSITVASNTLDSGTIITLMGSGGSDPSTLAASSDVLLSSPWTALDGAFISLEVFESNSSKFLIERNRG